MTIIQMLQKLSEIVPGVCKCLVYSGGDSFLIGDYVFWESNDGKLAAELNDDLTIMVFGPPALAWLQAAIQQVIDAEGWEYQYYFSKGRQHIVTIWTDDTMFEYASPTVAEVFLSSYLRAKGVEL